MRWRLGLRTSRRRAAPGQRRARLARSGHLPDHDRPVRERRSEQRHQRRAVDPGPLSRRRLAGRDRSPRLPARRSASPRCGSRRSSRTPRTTPASRAITATGRRTSCDPTLTSATSTKLRELVDKAHARGMLVILDVVTNHMGQLFYYDINGNGQPDDTISGGGYAHTCLQICAPHPEQCTPDELTYCAEGKGYLERIIEWDPDYDDRGVQGWTSLGFSGPATDPLPELARAEPHAAAASARLVRLARRQGVVRRPELVPPQGPRLRVVARAGLLERLRARAGDDRRLPRRPQGSRHRQSRRQGGADRSRSSTGSRSPTSTASASTRSSTSIVPRSIATCAASGATSPIAMRAKAKSLGKQNFFIFGEGFDGNDALIGSYTWGGSDAARARSAASTRCSTSRSTTRASTRCSAHERHHAADARHLECLYNARIGRNTTDAWCMQNGFPAGPDFGDTPHAMPADGGIGLAPNQVLVNFLDNHDVARFMFEQERPEHAPRRADVPLHVGRHPVHVLRHRAAVPRRRRSGEPRGHVRSAIPTTGYPAVRHHERHVQARAGPDRDAQGARGAPPAARSRRVWSTTRRRCAPRCRHLRVRARDAPTRPRSSCSTRATQASETCAPTTEGGACVHTIVAAGHRRSRT